MANELAKMRSIRVRQIDTRNALKHREDKNKELRVKITPIWTLEKEKRTAELETLTKALVEGRAKVRDYQKELRTIKESIKETNREYDLSKGE
jgi:hypothetical protein